jgi:hypothetical protein
MAGRLQRSQFRPWFARSVLSNQMSLSLGVCGGAMTSLAPTRDNSSTGLCSPNLPGTEIESFWVSVRVTSKRTGKVNIHGEQFAAESIKAMIRQG